MEKIILLTFLGLVSIATCNASNETTLEALRMGRLRDSNAYFVYTRNNPREPVNILATAAGAIAAISHFRTNTVVLVHDRAATYGSSFNVVLKNALLTVEDVSVVVLDWSWGSLWTEEFSTFAVPEVAAGLAEMLRLYIIHPRINAGRLHIVGFGLGAHIAGQTARILRNLTPISYEVARVTGLDPAGGSSWGSNSNRLTMSDATYVEVIHTDMSGFGIMDPLGHVDFYINGGINQPGCDIETDCSHRRAWEVFAASITHNLVGYECSGAIPIEANCRGFMVPVGTNALFKYGAGMYFVESTTNKYPYLGSQNSADCISICED